MNGFVDSMIATIGGGVYSVAAKQSLAKKYVVTFSAEEREHLQTLIRSGMQSARKLLRARILPRADASEAGDAWTDNQIACGLDTSLATVARVRQQLVEEGVEGVLTPKHPRRQWGQADRACLLDAARWPRAGRIKIILIRPRNAWPIS
jgi:hypothetical protein